MKGKELIEEEGQRREGELMQKEGRGERRKCQSPSGIRQQAGSGKGSGIGGRDVEQQQYPRRSSEEEEPDVGC